MLFSALNNLKVKYKIIIVFVVMSILILDLGALSITSVIDIDRDTKQISNQMVPQLIATSRIKDHLNSAIIAAYEYVRTGNMENKGEYRRNIGLALVAEIELFQLSTSQQDFEFTSSFEKHMNNLNSSLTALMNAYDSGDKDIQNSLERVSNDRDEFTKFLQDKIEQESQKKINNEKKERTTQVRRTFINVATVAILAVFSSLLVYFFIRRSVTVPLLKLTQAAQELGQGKFKTVETTNRDELGLFAQTFNLMSRKIKSTQEQLKIELEKTKKLDKQKTEFLSIAAHQLRTPISGIKWSFDMLYNGDFGKLTAKVKEQVGRGLQNSQRMIALINNLLDVTSLEDEKFTYQFSAVDINALLLRLIADFAKTSKQAKIIINYKSPAVPLPTLKLDKEKISIAIHNLIDNAIKYTPAKGKVYVSLDFDRKNAYIRVQDTGLGIPEKERERIFTKFYRGSNIQAVQTEGSGLGLFAADQIIQKHGGVIDFTSKTGTGSTFTIILPLK